MNVLSGTILVFTSTKLVLTSILNRHEKRKSIGLTLNFSIGYCIEQYNMGDGTNKK